MAQISHDYPIIQAITAETSDSAFVQSGFFMETEVQATDRSLRSAALSPLNVPELLCMIIRNLDPEDYRSAAREFREDIQSADWSRYAFYAPRIRVISLYFYSTVSQKAFQAFVDHIPSHLGLPRPSSIGFFTVIPTDATPLVSQSLPLISQSLKKLRAIEICPPSMGSMQDHTVAMQPVVSAVAMLDKPCLESLEVESFFSDATLLETLNMCLTKHSSKISTLEARLPFDSQTWDSIFGLPTLRTLDIAPFATTAPRPSEEIVSIIRTLVAKQPLLKSFQLNLPFSRERALDNSLYSQLMHELMGLRNLETLGLYVMGSLSLFESDVREMGASWPKIRNLQFYQNGRRSVEIPPRGITIQNDLSLLPSFLRYLPSLEELHIPFTCNPTLTAPQGRLPAPAFRILDLSASPSPEESHKGVAAYLAAVLPRSAVVQYTGAPDKTRIWVPIIEALESQRAESEPTGAEVDT
ncbi:hypothetical protein FRC04_002065 [Tulasnella sp. 424]|nr:hypothetical protein FRC04_002065 [Tulasnella sp. 424]